MGELVKIIFKSALGCLLLSSFSLISCSKKYLSGDDLSRGISFSKIMVLPVVCDGKCELTEVVQETLIEGIKNTKRFRFFGLGRTHAFIDELQLKEDDYTNRVQLYSLAEASGADAVIYTSMDEDSMELSLYSSLTGIRFYTAKEEVDENFNGHSAKSIARLLLRRLLMYIPYDALVMKTKPGWVEVNAGKTRGLTQNSRITIFEIISFASGSKRGNVERIPIAKAIVKRVKKYSAVAKIVKHNQQFKIEKFNKVSFLDFFRTVEMPKEDH